MITYSSLFCFSRISFIIQIEFFQLKCSSLCFVYSFSIPMFFKSLLKNFSFPFLFFLVLFSLIIFCCIQLGFQQTLKNNIFILLFDLFKSVKNQTNFISHFHFSFFHPPSPFLRLISLCFL
jgi:hypothetical protein